MTDSHLCLTQLVSSGFKSQLLFNPKLHFLYNNFLIIAPASPIRTHVINIYFLTPVDRPLFVYYPNPVFPNFILTWRV